MNQLRTSSGPRRRRKLRPLLMLFRITQLIVLLGVIWIGYLVWEINSVSIPKPEALPKTDAVIVLGASLLSDKPGPALKERLDYAYRLYQLGKTDKLILTGGLDHNGSKLTEAEGMRVYLVHRGVPADKLLIENKSTSTYENLLFSKAIADDAGIKQVLIVTNDFHSPRSADIARYVGFDNPIMTPFHSKVLNVAYNETREVLAFTKWKIDSVALRIGVTLDNPDIPFLNK